MLRVADGDRHDGAKPGTAPGSGRSGMYGNFRGRAVRAHRLESCDRLVGLVLVLVLVLDQIAIDDGSIAKGLKRSGMTDGYGISPDGDS
ncbi:hypothetical protein ACWDAO_13100 [Streptomyces sp. NPDC001212]|uniref:hypothetical protein n=1 Tax=unclassified Streptomyces TaxID=2593676 RepID=UPI001CD60E47|nr:MULTISPECIES: hypothetical protein [unclassified Streptomyces]